MHMDTVVCTASRDIQFKNLRVSLKFLTNTPTVKHNTHLKEQLLGVLGTVAEMGRDVVVPPTRGAVETQQICAVQQDRVQGVDPYSAGHQQQMHSGVGRRWVKEEVPTDAHGHPGAHCALREERER